MVDYETECWHCGRKFNISTAKTRYSKKLSCYECGSLAWYSICPVGGKMVMIGRDVRR